MITTNDKNYPSCEFPRKQEALGALLSLLWKKQKKDRPQWIVAQFNND